MTGRLVFGMQPVREAIRVHGSAVSWIRVLSSPSPTLLALERFASDQKITVEHVSRGQLDTLTEGGRHQGVAAEAPPLTLHPLDWLLYELPTLVLALDEIQDPQNFGAIVRSAVALAHAPILWGEHNNAPLSPTTFRASAGAIEHAKLVRVRSLRSALEQLQESGYAVVALEASASRYLQDVDLRGPTVLITGSEGKGLKKGVRAAASVAAKLPMAGSLDSLNASVAAALAVYEVIRQRSVTLQQLTSHSLLQKNKKNSLSPWCPLFTRL